MTKYFALVCLLSQGLMVTAMEESRKVGLTPSGNLLRCSQEALQKSQELDNPANKPDNKTMMATITVYYDGFCGGLKGGMLILNKRNELAPFDPHYHHDFV